MKIDWLEWDDLPEEMNHLVAVVAFRHAPTFTLERLERLPADLRAAVLEVLSKSPVSELLSMRLTLAPEEPRIPELAAA
jgi:hypothetical protein